MNIFAVCYTSIAENKKKYLVNNGARIFLNSHTHFNHIFVDLNLLWNIFGHFLTLLFLFRYNVAKILTRWKTSKKFFLVFSVQQFIVDLEKISLAVVTFLFVQKVCRLRKKNTMGTKLLQSPIVMTQMASITYFKDLLKWFKVKKGTFKSCSLTNFQDFLFYLETTWWFFT